MRTHGNPDQWPETYPSVEIISQDIERNQSYIIEQKGETVGTFVLAFGAEPTYRKIHDGGWPDHNPYATIHRLASNGKAKGIAGEALKFAIRTLQSQNITSLRVDTHADNRKMLDFIERNAFVYCGIIHVADQTPRKAYQLNINHN